MFKRLLIALGLREFDHIDLGYVSYKTLSSCWTEAGKRQEIS